MSISVSNLVQKGFCRTRNVARKCPFPKINKDIVVLSKKSNEAVRCVNKELVSTVFNPKILEGILGIGTIGTVGVVSHAKTKEMINSTTAREPKPTMLCSTTA